ncbi:MAG: SMP-30/gluconolactonase/LRE family protein [Fibrobacterota bacterium]|nr:SMP-30/gluconolactonase/LRE family protein [Fibrobacterota bacterium]
MQAVKFITAFAVIIVVVSVSVLLAQGAHTLPSALAGPGTPALMPRVGGTVFGEGVASDWQGNVYFNEMGSNNRTMQVKVGQDSGRIWRTAKDAPNGIWLDTQNRLIICQKMAIVRVKPTAVFDGMTDTLYKYSGTGQDFNDVTGDSKDNLYFTNFNGKSVFFRNAITGVTKEVLSNQPKPNGIEWDEERKTVYVCENGAGKVAAYTVGIDNALENRQDFATVGGADGIVLDSAGNVYAVAFGAAVKVFTPVGAPLGEIPIAGSQLTNLAFGGADFRTLFMITDKGLYKLPMKVKGYKSGQYSVGIRKSVARETVPTSAFTHADMPHRVDGKVLLPSANP